MRVTCARDTLILDPPGDGRGGAMTMDYGAVTIVAVVARSLRNGYGGSSEQNAPACWFVCCCSAQRSVYSVSAACARCRRCRAARGGGERRSHTCTCVVRAASPSACGGPCACAPRSNLLSSFPREQEKKNLYNLNIRMPRQPTGGRWAKTYLAKWPHLMYVAVRLLAL